MAVIAPHNLPYFVQSKTSLLLHLTAPKKCLRMAAAQALGACTWFLEDMFELQVSSDILYSDVLLDLGPIA